MSYNFDYNDIKQQVLDFMRSLDIQPYDERKIIIDGELHRYRTHDDKASQTSGAYCIHIDGLPAGFVQDWRKGIKEDWHFDTSGLAAEQRTYFNSEEFRKKAEQEHREAEAKRKKKQAEASEQARILWDTLKPAPEDHPYLVAKKVKSYGLRYSPESKTLAVPMFNTNGVVNSIQWITPDGTKRFQTGVPIEGLFFGIALDSIDINTDGMTTINIGEGYATMAKVYELTGIPCVAAFACHKLLEVAKIIKTLYPNAKIIVVADNDKATELKRGHNPGLDNARHVLNAGLAAEIVAPDFTSPDAGSDWDDFAVKYGDEKAADVLKHKIWYASMSEQEKKEHQKRSKLLQVISPLDPSVQLPPQEFIGGIFPRDFVSILVAPPGTGKTIFVQKFCSDLSLGGNIFDGFVEDEPVRKSIILAGEAGYSLLVRRGSSMKWTINPNNVLVLDQYKAETNDINILLDSPEGIDNFHRLFSMYKPDIVFIDTFSSFHESDENKAKDIKPLVKSIATTAKEFHAAVVLVHHSRKRLAKERSLSLNQDDVIGSSIFNRLVGLIVGIEPMKENENVLLVRPLKSWFRGFIPFAYTLKEDMYGGIVIQTDLAPAGVNNSKAEVWIYLSTTFRPGEWFSSSQIILSEINGNVTEWQLRRILAALVKEGKLNRRGLKRYVEYSIIEK